MSRRLRAGAAAVFLLLAAGPAWPAPCYKSETSALAIEFAANARSFPACLKQALQEVCQKLLPALKKAKLVQNNGQWRLTGESGDAPDKPSVPVMESFFRTHGECLSFFSVVDPTGNLSAAPVTVPELLNWLAARNYLRQNGDTWQLVPPDDWGLWLERAFDNRPQGDRKSTPGGPSASASVGAPLQDGDAGQMMAPLPETAPWSETVSQGMGRLGWLVLAACLTVGLLAALFVALAVIAVGSGVAWRRYRAETAAQGQRHQSALQAQSDWQQQQLALLKEIRDAILVLAEAAARQAHAGALQAGAATPAEAPPPAAVAAEPPPVPEPAMVTQDHRSMLEGRMTVDEFRLRYPSVVLKRVSTGGGIYGRPEERLFSPVQGPEEGDFWLIRSTEREEFLLYPSRLMLTNYRGDIRHGKERVETVFGDLFEIVCNDSPLPEDVVSPARVRYAVGGLQVQTKGVLNIRPPLSLLNT